ncbi:uncharacterized protein LOC114544647 [Dendronephthya gigantea]|uniref:uncharacterized protein LOC114544647 n=1 Tax=Dendronephthya gigantea TaxID=151771 RepID=UPI00106954F0|nr:uncharacterized protein LOC114544647 [Dendronephthya gigantea]
MTGEHPLPHNHPFRDDNDSEPPKPPKPLHKPPLLEISMACNDLKPTVENKYPNAVIVVSTMTPPGATWSRLAQTEIIEQKRHPYFLTTISIPSGGNYSEVTRLKLAVFDVRDRDKEEMTHLGQAVCTIKDILDSTNQKIQLSLTGLDSPTASGTITFRLEDTLADTDGTFRPRCGSINKCVNDNRLKQLCYRLGYRGEVCGYDGRKLSDVQNSSTITYHFYCLTFCGLDVLRGRLDVKLNGRLVVRYCLIRRVVRKTKRVVCRGGVGVFLLVFVERSGRPLMVLPLFALFR